MEYFVLDNYILLVGLLLVAVELYRFKEEFFPNKMRYSENISNLYLDYNLSRRYANETKRFLPQNKLHQFDEREGTDTSRIQRSERNFTNS